MPAKWRIILQFIRFTNWIICEAYKIYKPSYAKLVDCSILIRDHVMLITFKVIVLAQDGWIQENWHWRRGYCFVNIRMMFSFAPFFSIWFFSCVDPAEVESFPFTISRLTIFCFATCYMFSKSYKVIKILETGELTQPQETFTIWCW